MTIFNFEVIQSKCDQLEKENKRLIEKVNSTNAKINKLLDDVKVLRKTLSIYTSKLTVQELIQDGEKKDLTISELEKEQSRLRGKLRSQNECNIQ
jgi:hypothetical protein